MSLFFVKNDEPFVPEGINPQLAKLAKAIVKTCHLTLKCQMRTNGLNAAIKNGSADAMKDTALKCIEKNKGGYNADMSLTGVKIGEVDDAFFADKDADFWKGILETLVDMAAIRTVVDARMMPVMSAACEKAIGTPINKITFFVNQTQVLEEPETEDDTAEE